MKAQKKPVVVDAEQYFSPTECDDKFKGVVTPVYNLEWVKHISDIPLCDTCGGYAEFHGWVSHNKIIDNTGQGVEIGQTVCPGDWIVTEADGTVAAYKPQEFEQVFNLIESY